VRRGEKTSFMFSSFIRAIFFVSMRLLLVEDEPRLNRLLADHLRSRGFAVDSAFDGEEGEKKARIEDYDVLILDRLLPKRDGLTVCYNLRAAGKDVPVLFLTALDATDDRVMGLDAGGDDYLAKPFAMDELDARLRALLRRPRKLSADVLTLGELTLNTKNQEVKIGEKLIPLTIREYGILDYLLRHVGELVTREDLIDHVWDQFFDSFSNVVDVHLKNLRKKLPTPYGKRIQTVWGKGYKLV